MRRNRSRAVKQVRMQEKPGDPEAMKKRIREKAAETTVEKAFDFKSKKHKVIVVPHPEPEKYELET